MTSKEEISVLGHVLDSMMSLGSKVERMQEGFQSFRLSNQEEMQHVRSSIKTLEEKVEVKRSTDEHEEYNRMGIKEIWIKAPFLEKIIYISLFAVVGAFIFGGWAGVAFVLQFLSEFKATFMVKG